MKTEHTLSPERATMVQASAILDQVLSSNGEAKITIVAADGSTHELTASPEMIASWKAGLGYTLFGKTDEWDRDLSFSREEVSQALSIDSQALDGLVAKTGDNDRFTYEDVMPFLSRSLTAETEQRV